MFILEASKILFEPARTFRAMLGLVDFIVGVVVVIFGVGRREAWINVLRDEHVFFAHPLFTAREVCCFQRSVLIQCSAHEVGTIG